MTSLAAMDAVAQAGLVHAGECRPADLVHAAIGRVDRDNDGLNAIIHRRDERALIEVGDAGTDTPFAGVPVCVKDVGAESAGDPYHCGMRALARRRWRATTDAVIVRRLRAAGFVLVGRTNTPELAASFFTEPLAYGPTRNPWDPQRSPGGSSGGSAAAVAAGIVPLAIGNDMAGSIRVPASMCGVIGLKPSRRRISSAPLGERWGMLGREGVLTRSVRDCAAALDLMQGAAAGDPYPAPRSRGFLRSLAEPLRRLRIGFRTDAPLEGDTPDAACVAAVRSTSQRLTDLGHSVEQDSPAALDINVDHALLPYNVSVARDVDRWAAVLGEPIDDELEPRTRRMAERGRQVRAVDLVTALDTLHIWSRDVAMWWCSPEDGGAGFDVLVTPTVGLPPPAIGWGPSTPGAETRAGVYTRWWNITGQPAISLPLAASDDRLPVGVQFVAAHGREDVLLSLANELLPEPAPVADRRITIE